jgi:hypothetical protein
MTARAEIVELLVDQDQMLTHADGRPFTESEARLAKKASLGEFDAAVAHCEGLIAADEAEVVVLEQLEGLGEAKPADSDRLTEVYKLSLAHRRARSAVVASRIAWQRRLEEALLAHGGGDLRVCDLPEEVLDQFFLRTDGSNA